MIRVSSRAYFRLDLRCSTMRGLSSAALVAYCRGLVVFWYLPSREEDEKQKRSSHWDHPEKNEIHGNEKRRTCAVLLPLVQGGAHKQFPTISNDRCT